MAGSFKVSSRGIRAFLNRIQTVTNPAVTLNLPVGANARDVDNAVSRAIAARFSRPSSARSQTEREVELETLRAITSPVQGVNVVSEATAYAKGLEFELLLSGTHYTGVTNQSLLGILASQGRDFAADTPELRAHVRTSLLDAFKGQLWDDDTAGEVAQDAIKDWIIQRIENQGDDITLTPLSPDYAAEKAARGYDSRIGVRKGKWLKAVYKGRVRIDPK